ncbi:MAG TPA: trehalose-6-phosphate synthase [Acidimicrobiia bacterium]|nr:trehalose-6-phosphate synthase [Acidimicrobiia bacterium]
MDDNPVGGKLVVAAHRLPVAWDEESEAWSASPGGLVSALAPVLRERGGVWVGWNGGPGGRSRAFRAAGIQNRPVVLSEEEIVDHYDGFCNGTIWPLYHDAIRPLQFHRHWWRPHIEVNDRFAKVVARAAGPHDTIWVHDYQLQLVPAMVRRRVPEASIGFFLHIPFPPLDIFERLPWRAQVLEGLLGADYLGFQTRRATLNFAAAAREIAGATGPASSLEYQGRRIRAEAVPISVDVAENRAVANSPEALAMSSRLRHDLGDPEHVILGVDRLDYTKGIDLRLRAFEVMLQRHPELIGKVSLVQIAVPSREDVGEYQLIRRLVEELVGRINGRFARAAWTPIHYLYRTFPFTDLVGAYLTADVMLVTPLRDGMNLVALEYVATRRDNTGALILSEFAGAAERLGDALIVNPYDIDGLAVALHSAVVMEPEEQNRRMARLRRSVGRWDVHSWAKHNLEAIDR